MRVRERSGCKAHNNEAHGKRNEKESNAARIPVLQELDERRFFLLNDAIVRLYMQLIVTQHAHPVRFASDNRRQRRLCAVERGVNLRILLHRLDAAHVVYQRCDVHLLVHRVEDAKLCVQVPLRGGHRKAL